MPDLATQAPGYLGFHTVGEYSCLFSFLCLVFDEISLACHAFVFRSEKNEFSYCFDSGIELVLVWIQVLCMQLSLESLNMLKLLSL